MRTIRAAIVAVAVLGSVFAAAPAASAGWSDCPAGALCAYLSPNGGGTPGKVYYDNANLLQYYKFDNAESVYNHGNNCNVALYSGLNWSGSRYVLNKGWAIYDLNQPGWGPWWHNVASNDWCV